jgi:Icc protein
MRVAFETFHMTTDWPKILVLTDLHITDVDEKIIGLDTAAHLQVTLDDALVDHPDAVAMILMGDLTHHGRASQYARLAAIVADFPIPVIPMIGNHDQRDAFLKAFPDAPQTTNGFIQTTLDLPHHRIITLDTLDGPPYPKGHHSGKLCARRYDWLNAALTNLDGRMPIVFAHHPPFETGIVRMDLIKLADGDVLLDTSATYSRCHLFCGHIHRTISGSSRGVPWTMFKSTAHQGVPDLKNPDSSLSIDETAAYGVLLLSPDGAIAHSQDVIGARIPTQDGGSKTDKLAFDK